MLLRMQFTGQFDTVNVKQGVIVSLTAPEPLAPMKQMPDEEILALCPWKHTFHYFLCTQEFKVQETYFLNL